MILSIDVKETVGLLQAKPGNDYLPIGTCFYVNLLAGNRLFSYMVTNKHVVDERLRLGHDIYIRVNRRDALEVEYVKLLSNWVYHADPAVDIAVSPRLGVPGAYPASAAAIPSDWIVTRVISL